MDSELAPVKEWLVGLQQRICDELEAVDGATRFFEDPLKARGGISRPRLLEDGPVIERSAVNFSHTKAAALPAAATTRRPELTGQGYEAVSVSLIVHPRNPHAPTSHANFRFFRSDGGEGGESAWWFGGGLDLTPYYGYDDDAVHWHRTCQEACAPFGEDVHPAMKQSCDEYFFLNHRKEPRGIGGLFFDDLTEGGFERCFGLWRSISDAFLAAYMPILKRRHETPHGERERQFQLLRRGRYVEFNLLQDRGTLFGLQSGGRIEAILGSMPPQVSWRYDWKPEPGSPEALLTERFLVPRDWLAED